MLIRDDIGIIKILPAQLLFQAYNMKISSSKMAHQILVVHFCTRTEYVFYDQHLNLIFSLVPNILLFYYKHNILQI